MIHKALISGLELHLDNEGILHKIVLRARDRRKRPPLEICTVESLHHATGELVYREMTFDRKNNLYREVIIDPKTRKTIHKSEEPLTMHRGHGSAKRKSKNLKLHSP